MTSRSRAVTSLDDPGWTLDVTACLTFWLVLLYGISSRLVLPGFGAIGQPALLVALLAPLWWFSARMLPGLGLDREFQPVRVALYVYTGYMFASFGFAGTRMLTATERSNSTREMLALFALVGIALLVADGVNDLVRLRTLLRRLTTLGALLALLGILQAVSGQLLLFAPPGLEWHGIEGLSFRAGLPRPSGTGRHPIEYAVIVASLLPLAIHFALHARTPNERLRSWVEISLLLIAIPLSLSRTGLVCMAAAILVLGLGWSWRRRISFALVSVMAVPIVAGVVPGAYRVMLELFTGPETDPSIQARLSRVPDILALILERPWFGMGFGTFNGSDHFLIDNQLWVTMISTGFVGTFLTLGLLVVAALTATSVQQRTFATSEFAHLGWAIAAGIGGVTASLATFDAFYYRIVSFSVFLLIGAAGALWRLTGEPPGRADDRSSRGQQTMTP